MENWREFADYSIPLLVLVAVGWIIYKAGKGVWAFASGKVWDKLFNEQTGLMTVWFFDQHNLVLELKSAIVSVPTTLAAINQRMEELGDSYSVIGGKNSEMLDSIFRVQGDDADNNEDMRRMFKLLIQSKILSTRAETLLIDGNKEKAVELIDKSRELLEQAARDE